jgi:protein-L-isoaspartate(D-aspartate) O-methyltransferase
MSMASFENARRMMVDGQVRTNDVTDPHILAAMLELPRERFVPTSKTDLAYLDLDLPVTEPQPGVAPRCLLKPMVLAKLLQAAEITVSDRVLDVGCATGYSSAVLAHIAASVVAVEDSPELARATSENLSALGITTVTVRTAELPVGAPADGPYDAILINGCVEIVPHALCAQLKDGGRLVCVLRGPGGAGKAMLYRSTGDSVSGRPIFDAAAPLLPGFMKPPAFVF